MVLMIDNYDSFTYNLVQYFMQLGEQVKVFRNDDICIESAEKLGFDYLIISPGPGRPKDSGCSRDMIRHFSKSKKILGVCLGHQSIGEVFGAKTIQAQAIMHGKSDLITHDGKTIFTGLPNPLRVIRYHSLALEKNSLPPEIEISAMSNDGEIMAIRHKTLPIEGVQFHPESIGTEEGMKMLANFISDTKNVLPIKDLLKKTVSGDNLTEEEAGHIMEQITEGSLTPAQIGSLLTALTMKGASIEEITGFAKVLSGKVKKVTIPNGMHLIDTCGTGGDGSGSFNISTAAAFVSSGAGAKVAKHGNRSITSKSGSADILEALGVKLDMTPEQVTQSLTDNGIGFFFAPLYHPAFKNIMGPRRELGFRTVFNMMGPLLNPARVSAQIIGVFSPDITEMLAKVLENLGAKHAFVVHGSDGLDEITLTGKTKITELKNNWIRNWEFDPREFGFNYCKKDDLKGGNASENADILNRILGGEKGPYRDAVIINASAAIIAAALANDFREAIQLASESIDSGKAKACLDDLISYSKDL